jgi:hypothetical protein
VCLDLNLVKGDLTGDSDECVLIDNVDECDLADDFDEHKWAGSAGCVILLVVITWGSGSSEGVKGCTGAWGDECEDLASICRVEWCKVLGATGRDDCYEVLAVAGGDDSLAMAGAEDVEECVTLAGEDV